MGFIKIKGLYKKYPKFTLGPLDINIEEKKITGFIGVNGSGKTTTIKSMLNLIKPDQGEVYIFGKNALGMDEHIIKNKLGVIMDDAYFYGNLTIKDTEKIFGSVYSTWSHEKFLTMCEGFDLDLNKNVSQLSRGMKMKLSIALTFSKQTDGLIMDEPTSGLDPLIREDILRLVKNYVDSGQRSVIFSTHITSDLDKIADNIILIHDGVILFSGTRTKFVNSYRKVALSTRHLENSEFIKNVYNIEKEKENLFTGYIAADSEFLQDKFISIDKCTIEEVMLIMIKNRGE